ncbi:MAG: CHASE2 domain-containing protein [Akkermansiaceae bacterium]|nr:CHASE2 domain-containing protein [Akkermansiaceae bacterium]
MSFFGKAGTVHSRSMGRAVMWIGVVVAASLWAGLLPPASGWVQRLDLILCDELSKVLTPGREREDLVFLGIDEEDRKQGPDTVASRESRALALMRQQVGNERLDRRVYAELIEKLAASGAKFIIFDVLFLGSSGNPAADREFARALHRHHDRIVLSLLLQPMGDGTYQPVSSVEELPHLPQDPSRLPHEGYVNLWSDSEDEVVRRMVYRTTISELQNEEPLPGERVYESLSALTGRLLGAGIPGERSPRLRYAVSTGDDPSFSAAYAPHSLRDVFVPEHWETRYGSGRYFRDKVVLVSTSTLRDGDYHPIPGAVIYGGQFHLQALGSLLDNGFWKRAPPWVNIVALFGMAGLAVVIGMALRHPVAILTAALALGGGFVVLCAFLSDSSGVLFAGTPGLLGLAVVTICAELGHLVARWAGARSDKGEPG